MTEIKEYQNIFNEILFDGEQILKDLERQIYLGILADYRLNLLKESNVLADEWLSKTRLTKRKQKHLAKLYKYRHRAYDPAIGRTLCIVIAAKEK